MCPSNLSRCCLIPTKTDQIIAIVRHNLDLDRAQKEAIAAQIGCSTRQVNRAIKKLVEANKPKIQLKPENKMRITNILNKNASKTGSTTSTKKAATVIPKLADNMTFEHFCKYYSNPHYNGCYRWQLQWFATVWPYMHSLTKAARDHGKSIGHGNVSQYAMSVKDYDVLYLGWTSRRKEIAQNCYNFFLQRKELVIDKTSSPFHFKTIHGNKFDTFSVKSKEILGMHEVGTLDRKIIEENRYLEDYVRNSEKKLLLIIDDPIDSTFRKERHKETDLESFYQSTILNINPDKEMVVGTHKFDGDFLHFYEKTHEDDIIVYKRTPFMEKTDPRYGTEPDNPLNLLAPERWIAEGHPQYLKYLQLKKDKRQGKPITNLDDAALIKLKDLTRKRKQVGEYWWHSEYMQNPHPITGEVWKKVHYTKDFPGTAAFDMIVISIDRATTTNEKSDETGITIQFRMRETMYDDVMEQAYHNYLVMEDYTQKIDIFDLLPFIDKIYKDYIRIYQGVLRIIVVVEKQGGGDDFIVLAEKQGYRFAHCIIPVHSTINKLMRIKDTLGSPINNAQISFMDYLQDSKVVNQILTYPHMILVDALDSLCNGFIESEKLPAVFIDPSKIVPQLQHHRKSNQAHKDPSLQQVLNQNRRSIFR
jgi:hypothetical protein